MVPLALTVSALPQQASLHAAGEAASLPSRRPDERRLEARIITALRKNGHRALAALQCKVSGHLVILRGSVSSYYLKQLAQAVVLHVDGVREVQNLIDVE